MYKNIHNMLCELKGKKLIAIIDEGRSRKREEKCIIKDIYRRVFTVEGENIFYSFSYSDLICKTITLKML